MTEGIAKTAKPETVPLYAEGIPAELKRRPQWVGWLRELKADRRWVGWRRV